MFIVDNAACENLSQKSEPEFIVGLAVRAKWLDIGPIVLLRCR